MKKSEIKVSVTLRQILDAPWISSWDYICEKYHLNPWCINEGRADENETIEISLADAEKLGIVQDDEEKDENLDVWGDNFDRGL